MGKGGSTAYNTGLNGYSSRPTSSPITQIPSTYGGPGPSGNHWGSAPPTGPVYPMVVSWNSSYPQLAGDGGFCGGGGMWGTFSIERWSRWTWCCKNCIWISWSR